MTQRPNWFIGWPFDGAIPVGDAPPKVRVFSAIDLHITSVFLGAIEETEAMRAWGLVADLIGVRLNAHVDTVRLLGGQTPSAMSAIVADGAPALAARMQAQRSRLVDAGIARPEHRAPLPHVTFARIQRSASDEQRRAAVDWMTDLSINTSAMIDRLALYTWSADRSRTLFNIRHERRLAL